MPIKEQLLKLNSRVESLSHRKRSDMTYHEARDIAREIRYLLPDSNHFRLDEGILDKYSFKQSDKMKAYFIEEWKDNTLTDLRSYLMREDGTVDSVDES